ncbi:helix-turn-helix domain-containing protein [Streptomyces sp. 796.1]|uniref:helix-turn-helix domain-containing protein n=1 Tax=Streptomyces sp. 796.1 TaxID=3163029 RepID=UPI0039C9329C
MPARENPTARQVRLGAELRKLRDAAGKTAREAAGHLSTDQAKISHIEAGKIGVSEERIRRLAAFYGGADETLLDALCAIAREHRGQYWWDEYRNVLAPGFLDIAELEHHATALRTMHSVTLPGVFQTEEYARAVCSGHIPTLSADELNIRVAHRMRRRGILERTDPPPFEAIIHEAALRMRFGGRQVARAQLEALIEATDRPGVAIRVIPFTCEDFIEATQSVLYAAGPVPELDTIRIDSVLGGLFLGARMELKRYGALLDNAVAASLDMTESRHLIHHIAREL